MTHTKVTAKPLHGHGVRQSLCLSAATAMALLVAASPSLAQSIVSEGAVDPSAPGGVSWIAEEIKIGDGAEGSLTASGGATIEARTTIVGNGAEGSGLIVLTGEGTRLENEFDMRVGHVGEGQVRILDGAKAFAGFEVVLGSQEGSFGRLLVSGAGAILEGSPGGVTAPALWIGAVYGSGEMIVERGGTVRTGVSLIDTGAASVDGTGSLWEAGYIGLIDDDSTLTITNGARVAARSMTIAEYGSASASVDGTTSRLESEGEVLIGYAEGSFGRLTISNGATATVGDYLSIGEFGTGTLVVESGASLTSSSGYLGFEGQSRGTATVSGEGSRWESASFVLGSYDDSQGTLIVSGGGVASAGEEGEFLLGYLDNASGTIVIGAAEGVAPQTGGTIEGARLVFGEGSGNLIFNHTGMPDGSNLRFAPELIGTGEILHRNGTTYLDGNGSGFSGFTKVTGGRLMVMNGLGGSIEVSNGGFLGGVSTIGSGIGSKVTIGNGGTLGPGDPVGTLTIDGNLVFDTGSVFEVSLRANQPSDIATVTGTVDAAGGRVNVVTLDAETSYAQGGTYRILEAQEGYLSQFDGVDSESAFLRFMLNYSGSGLDLIVQTPEEPIDFSEVAQTNNQSATALALSELAKTGPSLALYNSIAMLGESTARNAFDQLSGEIHASLLTGLVEESRHVRNAANNRIRTAFDSVGALAAPIMTYGPDGAAFPSDVERGLAIWGAGFGSWGVTDSNGNAAALDRATGGLLFGSDAPVFDSWHVGLLAGYSYSSFRADDRSSSASSNNYHLGLYGGTQWHDILFRSGLAHSWQDIDTHRSVAFTGFSDELSAGYHARTVQAFGELATKLDIGGKLFEPFANLAYVGLETDAFAERGGAAALSSTGSSTDTIFTTLGLRAEHAFTFGMTHARLTGMIGWQHAMGDIAPTAALAFADTDVFTIAGAPIAHNSAIVEAGLELNISPQAVLGLSYQGGLSNGAQDHGFAGRADMKF